MWAREKSLRGGVKNWTTSVSVVSVNKLSRLKLSSLCDYDCVPLRIRRWMKYKYFLEKHGKCIHFIQHENYKFCAENCLHRRASFVINEQISFWPSKWGSVGVYFIFLGEKWSSNDERGERVRCVARCRMNQPKKHIADMIYSVYFAYNSGNFSLWITLMALFKNGT